MRIFRPLLIITCILLLSHPVSGAERSIETVLPALACAEGWAMDGKVALFDKDSLFDRINGESELYFPYGFEVLAYARYESRKDPKIAIDADVYKMGSLIDAFGMFANYRKKDDADISIGVEGTVSTSQLLFSPDRYFVRLQITGAANGSPEVLLACAGAISRSLPKAGGKPKELALITDPSVVKKSERYLVQSLLGYNFFGKGLIADALLNNEQVQVFIIPGTSIESARMILETYRTYLKKSGKEPHVSETQGRLSLEAIDPLYGPVVAEQSGRYLFGVVRSKDASLAKKLLERLRTKAGNE
jgi:hypothetical protein